MEKGAVFNCLVGLAGFLIYFTACGFKMEITPFSVIIVALLTLSVGFYTIVGFKNVYWEYGGLYSICDAWRYGIALFLWAYISWRKNNGIKNNCTCYDDFCDYTAKRRKREKGNRSFLHIMLNRFCT